MEGSESGRLAREQVGSRLGSALGHVWISSFEVRFAFEKITLAGWEGFRGAATRGTGLQAVMACTRMGQRQGSELLWGS